MNRQINNDMSPSIYQSTMHVNSTWT